MLLFKFRNSRLTMPFAPWAGLALILLGYMAAPARAQVPITLGDFTSPTVETFEGVVAPASSLYGAGFRVPATGFTFSSGLTLSIPSPNPADGSGFLVGDFAQGSAGYGLSSNGTISSPADLRSGTSYAGTGSSMVPLAVGFHFPSPVNLVGLFASTVSEDGVESPLVFTLFDTSDSLIGSVTFTDIQPVPLTNANFLGVGSDTPIGSFTIGVPAGTGFNGFFVFDDLMFQASASPTVPEPATLLPTCLAGLAWLICERRRRSRLTPPQTRLAC
jgi:hypothetical protein